MARALAARDSGSWRSAAPFCTGTRRVCGRTRISSRVKPYCCTSAAAPLLLPPPRACTPPLFRLCRGGCAAAIVTAGGNAEERASGQRRQRKARRSARDRLRRCRAWMTLAVSRSKRHTDRGVEDEASAARRVERRREREIVPASARARRTPIARDRSTLPPTRSACVCARVRARTASRCACVCACVRKKAEEGATRARQKGRAPDDRRPNPPRAINAAIHRRRAAAARARVQRRVLVAAYRFVATLL